MHLNCPNLKTHYLKMQQPNSSDSIKLHYAVEINQQKALQR